MADYEQKPSFEKHTYKPGAYYPVSVPIGEGKTDYEKYLRIPELLSLQKPAGDAASMEEMHFQIVHQVAELIMKLMMHDLDKTLAYMKKDELGHASRCFRAVNDCQRVLIDMVDLLGRNLSIAEYVKIRTALGQGSGMESPGFNWLLEYPEKIWEAFQGVIHRKGVSLKDIYMNYGENLELHTLAENLMDFDDLFHKWRTHHFDLVTRTIGVESNSLKGIPTQVLQRGVLSRFFPELLALRSQITNESKVAYGGQPLES